MNITAHTMTAELLPFYAEQIAKGRKATAADFNAAMDREDLAYHAHRAAVAALEAECARVGYHNAAELLSAGATYVAHVAPGVMPLWEAEKAEWESLQWVREELYNLEWIVKNWAQVA
jgi:hypothetical protein